MIASKSEDPLALTTTQVERAEAKAPKNVVSLRTDHNLSFLPKKEMGTELKLCIE